MWDRYYTRAVVQDSQTWHTGWRLEDLARQTANQRSRISALLEALDNIPPYSRSTQRAIRGGRGEAQRIANGDTDIDDIGDLGGGNVQKISLAKVLAEEEDPDRLMTVQCLTRPGKYLQVCRCVLRLWWLLLLLSFKGVFLLGFFYTLCNVCFSRSHVKTVRASSSLFFFIVCCRVQGILYR